MHVRIWMKAKYIQVYKTDVMTYICVFHLADTSQTWYFISTVELLFTWTLYGPYLEAVFIWVNNDQSHYPII